MSDYYETNAAGYAAIELDPEWLELRERFTDRLKPGSRVLDLGCGPGHDSHWFASKGFGTVSLDASSAMAAEAKRLYGIDVGVQRIEELDFNQEFDAVWASVSIHHVNRKDIPAAIAAVANALKPGGFLYASFKIRGEDTVDSLGRYYAQMNEADLRAILQSAGLDVLDVTIIAGTGADEKPADFVCATAGKSSY
ncbi:MAG: class I SAM-dependent methyltransferase [Rhizobiaceae bacterium]